MAPAKVTFSDSNAQPPVFVAGAFTEWQPVEITPAKMDDGSHAFVKEFDLAPGSYQYKFRLGTGDWWVCDGQAPITRDDSGNENNLLVVKVEPEQTPSKADPVLAPVLAQTPIQAPIINGAPKVAPVDVPPSKEAAQPSKAAEFSKEGPAPHVNGTEEPRITAYSQVTQTAEPEKPVEAASVKKSEPSPPVKETLVAAKPAETTKVATQPANKTVDGSTSPKPFLKEVNGKQSSESSLPPKEKTPETQEQESKKLGWFSRIFLCGSSGKIMMAAGVIIVPFLAAYVMQK